MTHISFRERSEYEPGRAEGLYRGRVEGFGAIVALGPDLKFGPAGVALLPEIASIADVIYRAIIARRKTAAALDDVRAVYIRE